MFDPAYFEKTAAIGYMNYLWSGRNYAPYASCALGVYFGEALQQEIAREAAA